MRLYRINGNDEEITLEEFIEKYLSNSEDFECDEDYRDYLNDSFGSIEIYGESFTAAEILENCDESNYYDGRTEWANDLMNEYIEEAKFILPTMTEDESVWIANWNITLVHEDVETDRALEELI